MSNYQIKCEVSQALAWAMESQRPFSWLKRGGDVQCGVYLTYTQQHFQQYRMK